LAVARKAGTETGVPDVAKAWNARVTISPGASGMAAEKIARTSARFPGQGFEKETATARRV
jgi:hypothetical protein